jgi:tellurite methyltransferase
MDKNDIQWETYYQKISGRQPRQLVIDVLERFGTRPSTSPRHAIDLGSGDGTETAYLLAHGWHVLAVDSEPSAFTYLKDKIPAEAQDRLQTQVAKFEEVVLAPADLIHASFSLPFCHPQRFSELWNKIMQNLNPGGRFAGQLFGVNDTWGTNADMTFFTREQALALFTGFEVESFHEEDEDGQSTSGPKHWHIFHVIAQKR